MSEPTGQERIREEHDPLARLKDEPRIENGVHHPYSAWLQGWAGRERGYAMERNPYEFGTREAHWWDLGWVEKRDDDGPPDPPSTQRIGPRRSGRVRPESESGGGK